VPRLKPLDVIVALVVAGVIAVALNGRAHALPPGYDQFTSDVTVWQDGSTMVVQASAVPNHKSPYFPINDPRYEAYNGSNPNWMQNPNHITTQTLEFRIPASPQVAATHPATPLGPIGVALNGVPFFNQYAGPNQPLTNEINSFDQYDGHPQQTGLYHYHVEPLYLTAQKGEDSLLGFLLDGFPVYGPMENGVPVTNGDLDQYHGHFHATEDYPGGIYHYHITAAAPYINGTGFYGTAGTVSYTQSATPTPTAAGVGGYTALPETRSQGARAQSSGGIGHLPEIAIGGAVLVALFLAAAWFAQRRRA
jgi:hypothetical protein